MRNSGFVTDSDTERELRKWQQARDMPIDAEKIRQQYKNKQNNAQGQHFEREILAGCRMYEQKGIATIDKTPEPFRVTSKNHRTGEFTGRFSTHAQPDFQGTLYGGRSIMFEAKRTGKDRITRNVLTDTQMDVLEKHNRLGALCGVCICIQDDFFFIPWNVWRDMKEMYGRQYLKADDIEEYRGCRGRNGKFYRPCKRNHYGLGGEVQKNAHIRAGEERNAGLGQYRHGSRDLHTNVRPYRRSTYRNAHDFFYKDTDTDSLEKDTGGRGKGIFPKDGSSR